MLFKLKEKLTAALGAFGVVLYYIISEIIYILPFLYIDCGFFIALVCVALQTFIPFIDIVFWIWGLVSVISAPQSVWSVVYYIVFGIYMLPEIIYLVITFFSLFGSEKNGK